KNGTNTSTDPWGSADTDDTILLIQFANGQIASTQFSSNQLQYYWDYGYNYQDNAWQTLSYLGVPK
ncbi:MAG: hypothetical protein RSC43_09315, partial [Clostridia bacterium]